MTTRRRLIAGLTAGMLGLAGCGSRKEQIAYALYSSKWPDVAALPHGSRLVLPGPDDDFTRGLRLLQNAHLVQLDRPSGPVTETDTVASPRHLLLARLYSDEHLPEVYRHADPATATIVTQHGAPVAPAMLQDDIAQVRARAAVFLQVRGLAGVVRTAHFERYARA